MGHPAATLKVPPQLPVDIVRAAIDSHTGAVLQASGDGRVEAHRYVHAGAVRWNVHRGIPAHHRGELIGQRTNGVEIVPAARVAVDKRFAPATG